MIFGKRKEAGRWSDIFEVREDFEGKFWARKSTEWFGPRPRSILGVSWISIPPVEMGPFDNKARAAEALAYLRDGPTIHERWERPA